MPGSRSCDIKNKAVVETSKCYQSICSTSKETKKNNSVTLFIKSEAQILDFLDKSKPRILNKTESLGCKISHLKLTSFK